MGGGDGRDERIKGGYPGGPSRSPAGGAARSRRILSAEEIEDSLARRRMGERQRRRRSRMVWGVVGVLVLAGAVGVGLGRLTHQTQEGLTDAAEARLQQDNFISREVNRTLLQLWKMEDIEAARNLGRAR